MTPPLYTASVPVFRYYLDRCEALVRMTRNAPERLSGRLAPDMLTGAQQFATAAGFSLRTACPLAGIEVPNVPDLGLHNEGLIARIRFARERLDALDPDAFVGAEERRIRHRAGFAELDQSGTDFLHLFGMPNFFFHLGMGFAVLRQQGADIGKGDYDGLHNYPQGFRF